MEKLLEKIRKLLALGTSSNEHEARLALARAQELMLKHSIDMATIEASEIQYGDLEVWRGRKRGPEQLFVGGILNDFFFVKVIACREPALGESSTVLFGSREHVLVARYVFVFLSRMFRLLWKEHAARCPVRPRELERRTYYAGLQLGFMRKLRAEREALEAGNGESGMIAVKDALIRAGDELQRALAAAHGQLRKRTVGGNLRGSDDHLRAGFEDGGKINLRAPIGRATEPQRRLGVSNGDR
jgi:hypothetical protein